MTRSGTVVSLASATIFFGSLSWGATPPDELRDAARAQFKPIPATEKQPPARVELGKKLFFDPRLSASALISCNTCHNLGLGGADLQEKAVGHGWQKGPRNSPTVFNAVYNGSQFWDGRAKTLAEQAKGPIQAAVEMNNNPEAVVKTLKSIPGYAREFSAAFPGSQDAVTFDNMAEAIAAFEMTLTTPDGRFDRFLKGDNKALAADEQEGLSIFMDKGCGSCHGGVNIGGKAFFRFGLKNKPVEAALPQDDPGRFKVTQQEKDRFVFRVPSLRNVALTPPYFHPGAIWRLDEAVRIMAETQLGEQLEEGQAAKVARFLATLDGEPPQVTYPILPPGSNETPRPALK